MTNFWIKVLAPLIKPEADALTALLVADKATIVSEIEAEIGKGSTTVNATVTAFINRAPSSFFFNMVKPELEAALTTELTSLEAEAGSDDVGAWFDAAVAKLTAFEANLGL
jgi:hypothetical protein